MDENNQRRKMNRKKKFKKLFNDDLSYTIEAKRLANRIETYMKRVYESYDRQGYNPREVAHVLHKAVPWAESQYIKENYSKPDNKKE